MKKYTIGYYHIPGALNANIYVEDMQSESKIIEEEIPYEKLNEVLEKYKGMYENHTIVEFKY